MAKRPHKVRKADPAARAAALRNQASRAAGLRHLKPVPATRCPGVPTFAEAADALRSEQYGLAIARSAARMLADPTDEPSKATYAIALYRAGRLAEAAPLFESFIAEIGTGAIDSVGYVFCLGYCRLELGDPRSSLVAMTSFLDYGNEWHPFYLEGLENTAAAWDQLGAKLESRRLTEHVAWLRDMQERLQGGRFPNAGTWPRRKVIETSFRILGVKATARPARRCKWPFG